MEYTVKFDFDCVSKRGAISRKCGSAVITSDADPKWLKESQELIGLIANDMHKKTKKSILSVEVTDIELKSTNKEFNN